VTAGAGGNSLAFLAHFDAVTAVEVDPDRAEDLLHNMKVVYSQQQQQQQQHKKHQQQQQQPADTALQQSGGHPYAASAAAAANSKQGNNVEQAAAAAAAGLAVGSCPAAYLGVVCLEEPARQQEQHLEASSSSSSSSNSSSGFAAAGCLQVQLAGGAGEEAGGNCLMKPGCRCGVVCADVVELLPALQWQDVIFMDPPWGGTNYSQPKQQQQQIKAAAASTSTMTTNRPLTAMSHELDATCMSGYASAAAARDAQDGQGGSNSSSGSSGSSTSMTAAAIAVGALGLPDLCVQLTAKCNILAVRLPSRCQDKQQFMTTVLAGARSRRQQQQQQQQQVVSACDQQTPGPQPTLRPAVAVRCQFGRCDLILFIQPCGGAGGNSGSSSSSSNAAGLATLVSQQHVWTKQLRQFFKLKLQQSASIISLSEQQLS
jgi:16S rRNA G966 N2-methylase RsmD